MLTLLIALLLSLVALVQIKLDYNKQVTPFVKPVAEPVQSVGVAYIMPITPLKVLDDVPRREVIHVDRRAQFKEWKDNIQSYEQVRLKLYTN